MSRAPAFLLRTSLGRRIRGFSLLEVVVSVALFAVIAALSYGGLDSILAARRQLDEQAQALARLQFAVGQIERDLRAAARRPIRDASGRSQPALAGSSSGFELSRQGYANALGQPRAEIERVGYRRQQQTLQRLRWAVLDRAPGSLVEPLDLLTGVDDFRVRYFARGGREFDRWPPPNLQDELPVRVEVEIELQRFGRIRRVLELPETERTL